MAKFVEANRDDGVEAFHGWVADSYCFHVIPCYTHGVDGLYCRGD